MPRLFKNQEQLAFEAWKYYATSGGTDKDRMIQIVSLLLGFSVTIISFHTKGEIKQDSIKPVLLYSGILVSLLAAFTAYFYGRCANRNWLIAREIAKQWEWFDLNNVSCYEARKALKEQSNVYNGKLAPVFKTFLILSIACIAIHLHLSFLLNLPLLIIGISLVIFCVWLFL